MYETAEKERQNFGLDPEVSRSLDPEQELESMIVLENDTNANLTDLPWYIMNPKKTLYRVQNTQIQLMTWITVILTPLMMVFAMMGSHLKEDLLWLIWLNDISWCLNIVLSFIVASPNNRTFKSIAKSYLTGYFFFDAMATLPPMITMQRDPKINLLKFLRLVHLGQMFTPFKKLIDVCMKNAIARKREDLFKLIVLFSAAILCGHLMACGWIALGAQEGGWIWKKQNEPVCDGCDGDPQFKNYEPGQIYIFSVYWVFTVLTTVGYGDYSGSNSQEYIYCILLEFGGLTFFSLLTGLIPPLVTPEVDFQGM